MPLRFVACCVASVILQDFGSDACGLAQPLNDVSVVTVLTPLRQTRLRAEVVPHRRLEYVDELTDGARACGAPVAAA